MNQEVTTYIESIAKKPGQEWQADVMETVRHLVFTVAPEATERLQYGKPHYLKNGKYLAAVSASKAAVTVTLLSAANVDMPTGFLEATANPDRKTVKITSPQELDNSLLTKALQQIASTL